MSSREEQASRRGAYFRELVENVSDVIGVVDQAGQILYTSPALRRALGLDPEDMLGTDVFSLVHPDDLASVAHAFEQALLGMKPDPVVTMRARHKDGSYRHFEATGRSVRDAGGITVVINARDVTDRVNAELERDALLAALERTTDELGAIFRALPDQVFLADAEGRILEFSAGRAAEPTTADAFVGKRIHDVLPAELADQMSAKAAEAHQTDLVTTLEYELELQQGRQAFEARYVPLRGQTVTVIRNITERREAEAALRRSEERLRESAKIEAIGRLAGGIAHDFNNLLMAILGYADLVGKRLGPSHELSREVGEIRKAGERAADLTKQLLAFGRRALLSPTVLDVNDVVLDMQAMLERLVGAGIELVTDRKSGIGIIKADRSQVEQVLLNLVVNARDACSDGGRIVVATGTTVVDDVTSARRGGLPPGPYVVLRVTDTGHGMDAETLEHIFEPFYTTKERGKGTGLGLATVHGVVKQSGGHVHVESAVGVGTTFEVYLPRVDGAATRRAVPRRGELPRGNETVLVVEDEPAVRAILVDVLVECGYRVLEAHDFASAEASLAIHPQVDLMVTDLGLPGGNGGDLAARVQAQRPSVRILFVSGNPAALTRATSAELLQKPFSAESFAERVRTVLDGPGPTGTPQPAPPALSAPAS